MNSNGTTYQNGRFVNVDEVHNNTKNMTLSGFNQEGGTVTGNIENLTIESKQNTSTTKGSTKGGSLSVSANGLPSGSVNYSKTNGERRVVDNASTFIIGDGSDLKVAKVENTASAIGTTENGKLSIDEYVGYNLENVDKLKTAGGSVGVSTSGITSIGVNYSDKKQEGITKNTVIGNVEIEKSSGDEINRNLDTMTEITEDRDFKTNINVESQTIKYTLNPSQFKEDLQIAIIEGKATGRTVVKTIDNVINGDKSQDIGDAERRSLLEIKEAIVRVQTAPAMDIIAEKDLADKNVQEELGVVIEKFDPNDPTLSEKVRERIDELKAEGKEIVAFYDKVTKKIFINQNAKDEEVRASIAREYKIKEDLKLGRGKENDKGQLRSTVAGEIAYDEIKDRLKKGDKNPISASSFDVAKMDKNSEVTADGYRAERKAKKDIEAAKARYRKKLESISAKYSNRTSLSPEEIAEIKELERQARLERDREIAEIEKGIESIRKYEEYAKTELAPQLKLINTSNYIPEKEALKARDNFLRRNIDTTKEYEEGTKKAYRDAFEEEYRNSFEEGIKTTVEYKIGEKVVEIGSIALTTVTLFLLHSTPAGGGELLPNEIKTKRDPRKIITPATYGYLAKHFPEYIEAKGNEYTLKGNYKDAMIPSKNQREKIDKVIFEDIKNFYYGTKTLDEKISESDGEFYGSLIGSSFGVITATYTIDNFPKVLNSTLKGGNISSISKISYKTENTSLALYDKSKTSPVPVATNGTLVPPLTTNKELATVPLLTDGAVSQVASKVGQVQNNRLPYKPILALPVKYPIKSKSGVTIYKDYAIGSRGAKYIEVGVSNNKEIVYKNNSGSYFKLTDNGLENISSKDVIKKEYFPTVKVQKNNGSNPSAGKNYYVSKKGNFKVEKYIEAGQTVEDYDKIYLIENVRARGINVGRSKEHTNTTISHWEKAVDIADEAKVDPNVKAVYVDETLKNISDKFKGSDARPDVTIEYKDGTFKLIEVQSKTDIEDDLTNKLKNIQNKYGKDVVREYDVKKPKGGK